MKAINNTCRSKGGKYAAYSCKTVSWDDCARGTVGGGLSCWGSNITDTYLKAKDGTQLFTVRPDNWNEKLGKVKASEIAAVVGNHVRGGKLKPVTLRSILKNLGTYAKGLGPNADLSSDVLDKTVSIRFQTTFLPVPNTARAKMEFATEAYNYNTRSDEDPKNLVLLCTTQGVAVQQDGKGTKRIFHHAVDERGETKKYWLEAERSKHKVGGAQKETAEERQDALARGKAISSVIGVRAMGTRFNVLMTIQVPLKQKPAPRSRFQQSFQQQQQQFGSYGGGGGFSCGAAPEACAMLPCAAAMPPMAPMGLFLSNKTKQKRRGGSGARCKEMKAGTANAARVSRGSCAGQYAGLKVNEPKRHPSECVTATVVIYNTISGGVPSAADVVAAVDDMEALYAACSESGRLAYSTFDFMKSELTVNDVHKIQQKLATQPPGQDVEGFDVFPEDDDMLGTVNTTGAASTAAS